MIIGRSEIGDDLELPFIPLSDGAGEVVSVGKHVTRVQPGNKVIQGGNIMSSVGTYRWSVAREGLLTRSDKFMLYRQLVSLQLQTLAERLAKMGLWGRPPLDADVSTISIPDSVIAREAEELAAEMYGPALNLHCLRTYFWGMLLGKAEGLNPDVELLYVASLLHDLGLSKPHSHKARSCCFAVTGAQAARDFIHGKGWDEARANAVFEAISLHLNLDVPAKIHGANARLLACGAHLDVVGSHIHRLTSRTIESVLRAYPRNGFVEDIMQIMNNPNHPDSRASFLVNLGFRKMAYSNPLERIETHRLDSVEG